MKFYDEYLKQYNGQGKTLAVIQVGDRENETRQIKEFKKDCEKVGIDFQWYYYNENTPTKQIEQDSDDIRENVDLLLFWTDTKWFILNGISAYAKATIELNISAITLVGSGKELGYLARELTSEGALVTIIPNDNLLSTWDYLDRSRLIVTEKGLNCYSLYSQEIIDINDVCINVKDRNVLNGNLFTRIGILEELCERDLLD